MCWKYKKQRQGHNRYEKSDLIALDEKHYLIHGGKTIDRVNAEYKKEHC